MRAWPISAIVLAWYFGPCIVGEPRGERGTPFPATCAEDPAELVAPGRRTASLMGGLRYILSRANLQQRQIIREALDRCAPRRSRQVGRQRRGQRLGRPGDRIGSPRTQRMLRRRVSAAAERTGVGAPDAFAAVKYPTVESAQRRPAQHRPMYHAEVRAAHRPAHLVCHTSSRWRQSGVSAFVTIGGLTVGKEVRGRGVSQVVRALVPAIARARLPPVSGYRRDVGEDEHGAAPSPNRPKCPWPGRHRPTRALSGAGNRQYAAVVPPPEWHATFSA